MYEQGLGTDFFHPLVYVALGGVILVLAIIILVMDLRG